MFKKNKNKKSEDIIGNLLDTLQNNPNQQEYQSPINLFPDLNKMPNDPFGQQQHMNPSGFNPSPNYGSFDVSQKESVINVQNPQQMNLNHIQFAQEENFHGGNSGQGYYQNGFQQPIGNQMNQYQSSHINTSHGQQMPYQTTNEPFNNNLMFNFPNQEQAQHEMENRINQVNIPSVDITENPSQAQFNLEEPKNMYEAKNIIFKLREQIHFLEGTLVSLQTNYDNERVLSKKQTDVINSHKSAVIGIIQEVMQTQKYKYEKEHGEISQLSYKDLIDFLKSNVKELLSTEKQKNAKLFTLLKETEEKNKRLENQLLHNSNNAQQTNEVAKEQSQSSNIFTNVNNIDKINQILGRQDSNEKGSLNQNFQISPDKLTSTNSEVKENVSSKLTDIKQDISSFSSEINDVTLHQIEESILKVIGETGVDNNDGLVKELESIRGANSINSFKTMIYNYRKRLIEKKLLDIEILDLPMKGYNNVELMKLSQKGISMYKHLCNKDPQPSYMVKRKNQHTSYPHSFVIDKIAEHLELNKFDVVTDEKELRFPVDVDGKQYHIEFDLIAKKGSEIYYIEVEMGTTKETEFQDKCNKFYAFTKQNNTPIVIMSPSKKIAEQNLNKVNNWMKSRGGFKEFSKEKKLKVLLPYFDEIKSNKWINKLELFIDLTRNDG